nr:hypothetical protein [Tanacetum cinerariifolium]
MSSSNHLIIVPSDFDIEDALSSTNALDDTPTLSNYSLTSPGRTSFNSLEDSRDGIIPPAFSPFYNNPYIKNVMAPKRRSTSAASTSETPTMTQTVIKQLVADSVAAALEAQTTTMANTNNTNRNTELSGTPIARKGTNDHKWKFNDRKNTTNNNNNYPNDRNNNRNDNNYQDNHNNNNRNNDYHQHQNKRQKLPGLMVKDKQEKEKIEQNRMKTGSVEKPDNVKAQSQSRKQ